MARNEQNATTARAISSVGKPAAFTLGPSSATTKELTPKPIARRAPVTRLRMRSSIYFTTMASVKGMAPNTSSMKPIAVTNSAQSCTWEAIRNSGTCSSRIGT